MTFPGAWLNPFRRFYAVSRIRRIVAYRRRQYDRWAKIRDVKSTVERRRNTCIWDTRIQGGGSGRRGALLFGARVGIKSVRTLRVAKVYWLFEAIKPAEQFDSRNTRDCRVYFPSFAKRTRVNTTFETIKDHRYRMTLQMNWRYHGEECLRIVSRCSLQVLDRFLTYFESVRETGKHQTYYSSQKWVWNFAALLFKARVVTWL